MGSQKGGQVEWALKKGDELNGVRCQNKNSNLMKSRPASFHGKSRKTNKHRRKRDELNGFSKRGTS